MYINTNKSSQKGFHMAINTTGPISIGSIVTEFGGTAPHSLSEYYRNGPFVTSNNTGIPTAGTISLSNFYGAVKLFIFNITEDVQQINLRTYLLARGWDGNAPVQLSLAAGRYLWSDSTAVPAVTTGTFPGGLVFTNNGFIMGKGGAGGNADARDTTGNTRDGRPGGTAISLSAACSIINNGYIGGGGGGGGAGPQRNDSGEIIGSGGGGGAGGGAGGTGYSITSSNTVEASWPGGAGGAIGTVGGQGTGGESVANTNGGGAGGAGGRFIQQNMETDDASGGGGGGRIFPGVGGVGVGSGGSGGSAGNPGVSNTAGGGGGWGAAGGDGSTGTGGAGGPAIARNGFTLTLTGNISQIYGATA
jgi:hypothetical protein